jgi:hypothetical protein
MCTGSGQTVRELRAFPVHLFLALQKLRVFQNTSSPCLFGSERLEEFVKIFSSSTIIRCSRIHQNHEEEKNSSEFFDRETIDKPFRFSRRPDGPRRTSFFSSHKSDDLFDSPASGSERSDRTLRTRREAEPTFAADDCSKSKNPDGFFSYFGSDDPQH